jgi:acid phosphatase
MNALVTKQLEIFCNSQNSDPPVTIWSAHDSTLIGLLCAYRLEQPTQWPEYASYLIMELLQQVNNGQQYVRFSLNGQYLRSKWEGEEPTDMIPLQMLVDKVQTTTGEAITSSSR